MAQIQVPVWGACPLRSPVLPPKERKVFDPGNPAQPESILGPCIQAACGFWKITKTKEVAGQLQPVEGMCGVRFLGEVFNSIAGSLEQLVKIESGRKLGEEVTFSTEDKPS